MLYFYSDFRYNNGKELIMKHLLAILFLSLSTVASAEVIRRVHAPQVVYQPQMQSNVMGEVIAVQPNMMPGPVQHMYMCEQQRHIGGTILGGIAGAVIGSKTGGDFGAVLGGIAGAMIGDDIQNSGKQVCSTRAVQMQTVSSYTVRVKAWSGPTFLGFYDFPMTHAPPLGSYVRVGM
jgi:uncharacterized protein YcfJ